MSSIIEKIKDVVHPDKKSHTDGTGSHVTDTTGHSGVPGTAGSTTGTHGNHGLTGAHGVDTGNTHGTHGGVTGTHGGLSGAQGTDNYSGLEGSHGLTGTHGTSTGIPGTTGNTSGTHGGLTGTHGGLTGGQSTGNYSSGLDGPAPNTAGPHGNDLLNRADPRVDSDQDNSRTIGGNTTTGQHVPEGTYGTHGTRAANIADPRIDSDNDRTLGLGATGTSGLAGGQTHGHTGQGLQSSNAGYGGQGLHSANEPNVGGGSHLGGTHLGGQGYQDVGTSGHVGHQAGVAGHSGPGPAEGTAGPHKSNILNKLDPRVDSDLDNSKTVGVDKTYAQS